MAGAPVYPGGSMSGVLEAEQRRLDAAGFRDQSTGLAMLAIGAAASLYLLALTVRALR